MTTLPATPTDPAEATPTDDDPPEIGRAKAAVKGFLGSKVSPQQYDAVRLSYRFVERGTITLTNTWYDLRRYYKHSFVLRDPTTPEQMRYFLRMRYHTFEKGLAMPDPRPGFGQQKLAALLRVLDRYESQFGYDELVGIVVNVLTEYQAFNAGHRIVLEDLDARLAAYRARYPQIAEVERGGTIAVTRGDIEKYADLDFEAFARCRYSIRNYAPDPVGHDLIESAVRVAQKSPSVCNRQAPRVHVFTEKEKVDFVLSYQLGHRGFGHTIPCVMVITSDLQSYYKPGERFQAWIDGGLFTMSLIFGLHAQGLGTCCLNWNVTKEDDLRMREAVGIPDNEVVITMLAVGHLPETFSVAESPRRPLDEVLKYG